MKLFGVRIGLCSVVNWSLQSPCTGAERTNPFERRLGIIHRGGQLVLWSMAIIDVNHYAASKLRDGAACYILRVQGSEHPAAGMEIDADRCRLLFRRLWRVNADWNVLDGFVAWYPVSILTV